LARHIDGRALQPPGVPNIMMAAGGTQLKNVMQKTVLVEGKAAQNNTLRWEDYATTAMDPSDDCTFWYVGDYLKAGATGYTTRIGAFRIPGCHP